MGEPRTMTVKRAAALMEFASWPETRRYRRKVVSMRALEHFGLVEAFEDTWVFTDDGRRIAQAMLETGARMLKERGHV